MGVQKSLAENQQLKGLSSRDALMLSLMPGISSKAWRTKKKRSAQRSDWDNSGHGLFFAQRLFGKLGHFFIASGENAIVVRPDAPMKELRCQVEGTVVSMQLNVSDEVTVENQLKQISRDAFLIKEKYGTRSIDVASVRAFLQEQA